VIACLKIENRESRRNLVASLRNGWNLVQSVVEKDCRPDHQENGDHLPLFVTDFLMTSLFYLFQMRRCE
jgi:hypothetical protein